MLNILREDDIILEAVPEELLDAWDMYRALLHEHALFDYSELLSVVVKGSKHRPGMASGKSRPSRAAEVPHGRQYQDVNPIQERLIQAMVAEGAHLTQVGDDDQTIMLGVAPTGEHPELHRPLR